MLAGQVDCWVDGQMYSAQLDRSIAVRLGRQIDLCTWIVGNLDSWIDGDINNSVAGYLHYWTAR